MGTLFTDETEYENDIQTLTIPEKDFRSVSPEIIEVAKSTVQQVIEDAREQVNVISKLEASNEAENKNDTGENPKVDPNILNVAQLAVTNIIEDAKTKISLTHGEKTSIGHFQEIKVTKSRASEEEDRFLTNQDNFTIKDKETEKEEKQVIEDPSSKTKSKQEQVEKIVTEF